jgi:hypothetical protein
MTINQLRAAYFASRTGYNMYCFPSYRFPTTNSKKGRLFMVWLCPTTERVSEKANYCRVFFLMGVSKIE